jgi:hypothetical protein
MDEAELFRRREALFKVLDRFGLPYIPAWLRGFVHSLVKMVITGGATEYAR